MSPVGLAQNVEATKPRGEQPPSPAESEPTEPVVMHPSSPGDVNRPDSGADQAEQGQESVFERVPDAPWEYESVIDVESSAEPAGRPDPKLDQLRAELERMERGDAAEREDGSPLVRRPGLGRWSVLRAVSGLCVVLALILLCAYCLKKFGGKTPFLAGAQLGTLLGKLHLSPRASLHFVRTGGRVLVVGVTQNAVSLISEFDVETFQDLLPGEPLGEAEARSEGGRATDAKARFLAQFRAKSREFRGSGDEGRSEAGAGKSDADIDSLRQDILRLQEYLRDSISDE